MALGLIAAAALQAASPELNYTLTIQETAQGPDVHMHVDFLGDEDGETILVLPSFWGGEDELWTGITGLSASGEDAVLTPGDSPESWTLNHAPGAAISLDYQIIQDRDGAPSAAADDSYRPFVQPDFVHLIGNTIFILPDNSRMDERLSVTLEAPDGWALASDLQHGALDVDALMASVIVAGDFRVMTQEIGGAPVRVAVRGALEIDDQTLMDNLAHVIEANLEYWGATGEPYLVTVLPLEAEPDWISIGGTNLADSFAMFITTNAQIDTVKRILAHEHTHTWNVKRLGGPLGGEQEEPAGYWFSEGFTDYLTTRAGVRGGSFTAEQGVAQWNEFLRDYASSPVNTASNQAILEGFWSDPNIQRLPYLRGQVFAALADARILSETHGAQDLDDVIHAMLERSDEGPAPSRFIPLVREVTGVDLTALYDQYILQGEMIWLPEDAFGACGPVQTLDEPVFVYGFTLGENENGERIITEVEPGSNAEAAGFEPGMFMIQRVGGAYGDASVQSVMRIRTVEGEEREIAYWPTNGEVLRVQQIAYSGEEAACRAALAGLN
ncbi:hypothetical protein ACFELO_00320 [Oceanicaulis sp. LC35]|uniref:M61 family metallopeptidase n=1 Tax=Oceanicaulis sp. LC35 TaxID=3349635 RepID=UPI003F867527